MRPRVHKDEGERDGRGGSEIGGARQRLHKWGGSPRSCHAGATAETRHASGPKRGSAGSSGSRTAVGEPECA